MIVAAFALLVATPDAARPAVMPSTATSDLSDADSYLDYLLADDVLTSGEFRMAFIALGLERTCKLLRPAYGKAMSELTPAWRQLFGKMIASGVENPGPLLANAEIGPEKRKVLLGMGLAGNELVGAKSETIKNMLADEALKVPDASINYEEREKEMAAAKESGTADCGLMKELGER